MVSNIGNFLPPDVRPISDDWSSQAFANVNWQEGDWVKKGESNSFYVFDRQLKGVAKPGKLPNKHQTVPRAAHEKIVSDLAAQLGLPIPPVTLFDRGKCQDGQSVRYVAVSHIYLEQPWNLEEAKKHLTPGELEQISRPLSAIFAFEEWIYAHDRKADHVLVEISNSGESRIACIDYAWSLSCFWGDQAEMGHSSRKMYWPGFLTKSKETINDVAEAIHSLPHSLLDEIVDRVPECYLSYAKSAEIKENLKERQTNIKHYIDLE